MIKAEKLSIEFSRPVFQNLSFMLGNGEKVGLVGLNGCGKTTLLKILAGEEKQTLGEIEIANEKLGYLPQEFEILIAGEIPEFLGEFLESLVDEPHSEMWKINKILSRLEFDNSDEFRLIESLSPGEKMKLYLAKLLIEEPTILLLDEPTNHLDIIGIEWFENFIKSFEGICIIISHDRLFLNNVANRIFEIDQGNLNIFEGNYDQYLILKDELIEKQNQDFLRQQKHQEKLETLIANSRRISDAKKRGKAVRAAKKRLEREVLSKKVEKYKELKLSEFAIEGKVHDAKRILEVKNITFGYSSSKNIFEDFSLEIFGKQKLWIKGANGAGKSTLVKLLVNELTPVKGEIRWGENIRWEYFAQEHSDLIIDQTVHDFFIEQTGVEYTKSFGALDKFLFDKELIKSPVKKLSPGQRSRLLFSIFAQRENQCLILDEPTNHLDIQTKEIIENSLREYQGAVILISHDRYFAEQIEPDFELVVG